MTAGADGSAQKLLARLDFGTRAWWTRAERPPRDRGPTAAGGLLRRSTARGGSAVSKAIVGHTTDRMHEHYAVVSNAER